jgi:hypothetical protein
MGLLKRIRSIRSKRRLSKSAAAGVAAAAASNSHSKQPIVGGGDDDLFEYHVVHEIDKDDSKLFRWLDKTSEEGCLSDYGTEMRDDATQNGGPRPAACTAGWAWMYSCFDWSATTYNHQLDHNKKKEFGSAKHDDDDPTQASTPYDEWSGESSQVSMSRVGQTLEVPTLVDDIISDVTSIPSVDSKESDSDSESSEYSGSDDESVVYVEQRSVTRYA